jgi:taurine dioxygenase
MTVTDGTAQSLTRSLEITPLSGNLGAEIKGLDLAADLSAKTVGEIRQALLDHHVIFFRGQNLSPEQQIAFGRRFGELDEHPFVEGMSAHPEIIEIITEPEDLVNFGGVGTPT